MTVNQNEKGQKSALQIDGKSIFFINRSKYFPFFVRA